LYVGAVVHADESKVLRQLYKYDLRHPMMQLICVFK
jgi:hypothetical protein